MILSLGISAACSNQGCLIMKQVEPAWSWSYSKSLDLKEFAMVHVEYSYDRPVPSQVA